MDKAQLKWLLCACLLVGCSEGNTEAVSPATPGNSGEGTVTNACGASNPCKNGQICTANGCVQPVPLGGSCKDSESCGRGTCSGGVCKVTVMPGQACDAGHACSESDCVDGICLKPVAETGDCRSSLRYCKDGNCVNGYCKAKSSSGGKVSVDCKDSDGDTIGDDWDSCDNDTDNDTLPDCLDLDSDGDTLPDALESMQEPCSEPLDSDRDGVYNFMSKDSDGNGIEDKDEAVFFGDFDSDKNINLRHPSGLNLHDQYGKLYKVEVKDKTNVVVITDSTGATAGVSIDPQTHELLDATGASINGLVLTFPDLDNDGYPDYADTDNDGDGIGDHAEITGIAHAKYGHLGADAPRAADCDWNGVPDNAGGVPTKDRTDLRPFDCDSDGIPDYMSNDSDGDGIDDYSESLADSDGDGYLDRYERDSDGDGVSDSVEFGVRGNGPAVYSDNAWPDYQTSDVDGDGLIDGLEVICDDLSLSCGNSEQTACHGVCVNLQTNARHCGACDNVCESNQVCEAGECVAKCDDTGLVQCGNFCVDTQSDPRFCGSCDTTCENSQVCMEGVCTEVVTTCLGNPEIYGACNGVCVNLKTDNNNCGSCGTKCTGVTSCVEGNCDPDPIIDAATKVDGRFVVDSDGDGFSDGAEYTAATAIGADARAFICDPTYGVKADPEHGVTHGAFEFYFELPYGGDEQDDTLNFKPQVSKLDVVFNLDTTNSMGGEVKNLQQNIITNIYPKIQLVVENSAFGVSRFDDFPTRGTPGSKYDYLPGYAVKYGYGRASESDVPYQLLGKPETDETTVKNNVNALALHNGGDLPESGYEALWQLVMGDDRTKQQASWYAYGGDGTYPEFSSGTIAYTAKSADRWGGAGFRNSTLPVVIHITDTISHDEKDSPYDPSYVENPHYSSAVHKAYVDKGARVISIFRKDQEHADELDKKVTGRRLNQLIETSEATRAIVPVCAFKQDASSWLCGADKCCTEMNAAGVEQPVEPTDGKCVLSYGIDDSSALSNSLVAGVDALVKYATSQVAAVVHGEAIEGTDIDTSCFIKRVEAFETYNELSGYVAPPQEPETSCNPVAVPAKFDADYFNGYSNFAIGTSSSEKAGAQLNFRVVAQNDKCVKPTEQAQVFTAHIDIVDPVTGVNYGTREVSIIVPGEKTGSVN